MSSLPVANLSLNEAVGKCDVVMLVFDTLRYDVAAECFEKGLTPQLSSLFPSGWEQRHTPASFTFPAHLAFFAGFLPTPVRPPWPSRLYAARFAGSETTGAETWVFDEEDVVSALEVRGYHTICIGGVGFFNKQTALSNVLPGRFKESHWTPEMGVTSPDSTRRQFELAAQRLGDIGANQRVFLFINISAIHQPNCFFLPGAKTDNLETHAAALRYVDSQLPILLSAIHQRGETVLLALSDHGTLYGEDGFTGHRVGHPAVWTVPYAHRLLGSA